MPEQAERDYLAYATAGVATLQRWYVPWTGRWRTTGWWNAANALTSVIDYIQRSGDRTHARIVPWTFRLAGLRHRHFLVRYFDDNGWWGLAWIKAYDLTGEDRYLAAAQRIFDNLVSGWDDTCAGGVWWNEDREYKNAITNELFLTLAVQLHLRTGHRASRYLDWALREWDWFSSSGMIGAKGLVNDGLTADCKNNNKPAYTYNQGVILGGLVGLFEATGSEAYLRHGELIADAALRELTTQPADQPSGILAEPGEANMVGRRTDGTQFKGIFVRYLYDLYGHCPHVHYRDFMLRNADSVWDSSRNVKNQLGLRWTGPFDAADASRQSSAIEVLNAALALTRLP